MTARPRWYGIAIRVAIAAIIPGQVYATAFVRGYLTRCARILQTEYDVRIKAMHGGSPTLQCA